MNVVESLNVEKGFDTYTYSSDVSTEFRHLLGAWLSAQWGCMTLGRLDLRNAAMTDSRGDDKARNTQRMPYH